MHRVKYSCIFIICFSHGCQLYGSVKLTGLLWTETSTDLGKMYTYEPTSLEQKYIVL